MSVLLNTVSAPLSMDSGLEVSVLSDSTIMQLPPYDPAPISEMTERIVHDRQRALENTVVPTNNPAPRLTMSIKVVLLALVLVVAINSAILVWLGVTTANESVNDVVTHLRQNIINQVSGQFRDRILRPLGVLEQASYMFRTGLLNKTNRDGLYAYLYATQYREPTAGYYFGFEDNMFTQVSAYNQTVFLRPWRPAGPLGSPEAMTSGTYQPINNPLPETNNYARINNAAFVVFNTTQRPWYVMCKQDKQVAMTSIYTFYRAWPGTTGVSPIYDPAGNFIGVAGTDFDLRFLSEMLTTLYSGFTGVSYVIESNGLLVATSKGPSANGTLRLAGAASPIPLIADSATLWNYTNLLRGNETYHTSVVIDSVSYWVDIVPLQVANVRWYYVSLLPEDDFLSKAKTTQTRLIIIACVVGGACLLYALLTVMAVTRPLNRLRRGMDSIARMDVSTTPERGSSISEVSRIEESYNGMVAALDSFSKFVPTSVIRNIIVTKEAARPDLRNIDGTVMFMDIAGFTTMCEKLPPDTLLEVVGSTFERASEAVHANNGTVDKFIGDCMMAFWNAPDPVEDHRFKSVKTAFECQQLVQRNNVVNFQPKYDIDLHIRIGIQSGPMKVGNFGSWHKLNYTVLGDTVNQASRFEALNKEYGSTILVGEPVLQDLSDKVVFRLLDIVRVYGKKHPTPIYEVLAVVYPENMLRQGEVELQDTFVSVMRQRCEVYANGMALMKKNEYRQAVITMEDVTNDVPAKTLKNRCQRAMEGGGQFLSKDGVTNFDHK